MVNPVAEIGMIRMAKLLKAFRSKSMKLRILILLCSMSFALMASAQASGGQIRRSNKVSSSLGNKGNRTDSPQINVISESEKTCELYFDVNKQKTCIPKNRKGKYVIPSKVRGYTVIRIGDFAFYNCEINELEIPNTVTCIGNNAFGWCHNLSNIIIPESVKSIGSYAFERCEALCSISIPNSVVELGSDAFRFCHNLSTIFLSDNLTAIKNSTFDSCRSLENVNIPQGVISIQASAFSGCERLCEIQIPSGVKIIANNTFSHCTKLTNVYIPEGVTKIEENAFRYTRISTITLPNSINYIAPQAFYNCERLTKVISHITTPSHLGQDSFNKANSLTLIVPKGTKHLYNQYGWNNFFSTIIEQ